jgi:2-hydroxychromene-2-carboxylate isomerase
MATKQGLRIINAYFDVKSPHAYLAVAPTLKLQEDYHCLVNWLPYELSYIGIGVSTSVEGDRIRRPPNEHATRKAKMYYTTAREYAKLQGLKIRGPHQLLDSHESLKAMLYAKKQGREIDYLTCVFDNGW